MKTRVQQRILPGLCLNFPPPWYFPPPPHKVTTADMDFILSEMDRLGKDLEPEAPPSTASSTISA